MDTSSVVIETHEYLLPKRAVLSMEDMAIWEKSEAYYVSNLISSEKQTSPYQYQSMSITKTTLKVLVRLIRTEQIKK